MYFPMPCFLFAALDLPQSFAQRDDGVDPAYLGVAGRDAPVRAHGRPANQGKGGKRKTRICADVGLHV